jgi:hypothetical protein
MHVSETSTKGEFSALKYQIQIYESSCDGFIVSYGKETFYALPKKKHLKIVQEHALPLRHATTSTQKRNVMRLLT